MSGPAVIVKLPGREIHLSARGAAGCALTLVAAVTAALAWLVVEKPEAVRSSLSSPLWLSAGLWVLMIGYWNARAMKGASVRTGETTASRGRHQMLLYLALLLAFAPIPGLRTRWLPLSALTVVSGLAVQVASMLLDLWAMRCLGRNWSGAVTIKVDHQLVRSGPYRLVRHPIYTAMIGMFLGTAVVSGEIHGLLAVLVCAAAYWRKVRIEDQGLREVFGQAYEDYRRESWALIPWIL